MEGLNSLFSAVKRKARGYRSVEYMTTMLYFVAGKLQAYAGPHCSQGVLITVSLWDAIY